MSMRHVARTLAARSSHITGSRVCVECGRRLSAIDRVLGRDACAEHRAGVDQRREALRARYLGAITAFDLHEEPSERELEILASVSPVDVGVEWHARVATSALLYVIEQAAANSIVSPEEARHIDRLAGLAGLTPADALRGRPDLQRSVAVASANGGRLTAVANPTVRLRKREVCYLDVSASLMKQLEAAEVAPRRGLAAAKGARVPVLSPAQLPELGSGLRVWDEGRLVITDQRLFFEGNFLSLQVPHRRLIGFNVFREALQVRIAGRRAEPIVRTADPLVAAAVGNAAWQQTVNALPTVYAVDSFESLPITSEGSSRSEGLPVRG